MIVRWFYVVGVEYVQYFTNKSLSPFWKLVEYLCILSDTIYVKTCSDICCISLLPLLHPVTAMCMLKPIHNHYLIHYIAITGIILMAITKSCFSFQNLAQPPTLYTTNIQIIGFSENRSFVESEASVSNDRTHGDSTRWSIQHIVQF